MKSSKPEVIDLVRPVDDADLTLGDKYFVFDTESGHWAYLPYDGEVRRTLHQFLRVNGSPVFVKKPVENVWELRYHDLPEKFFKVAHVTVAARRALGRQDCDETNSTGIGTVTADGRIKGVESEAMMKVHTRLALLEGAYTAFAERVDSAEQQLSLVAERVEILEDTTEALQPLLALQQRIGALAMKLATRSEDEE